MRRLSMFVATFLRGSALAIALGAGIFALSPDTHAALADEPLVKLTPLATPKTLTATTKAGTPVPVWLFPSPKVSGLPAPGEIVLISFDCGDGVSIAPLVQMFQAMGVTVVVFDNPLAAFDNPLAGFDNPLAAREKIEGDMGVATTTDTKMGIAGETHEYPADVVHAMISWASTKAIPDGKRRRVHLFGVGRGAELAVKVGGKRLSDLHSILVDSPTFDAAEAMASNTALVGDPDNRAGYRGLRIVRALELPLEFSKSKLGSIALASESMTYPKTATFADLAANASYQRSIADLLGK